MSSSSTAINACPPCIVPGLVRGLIGRSSTSKSAKLLNVGHGGMQVRAEDHMNREIERKEDFDRKERILTEDMKQFLKLFQESTFEGSRAAALKMKKYAKRQTKLNQKFLLFHSLEFLVRASKSEMRSWPNSPVLVLRTPQIER
jgi:hypothetical protein